MQNAATHAGQNTQFPIDLSDDADMTDIDGDMYDLHGNHPPAYAQHAIGDILGVVTQSERAALAISDRTSVGCIVVATVIIYVTWVTMQVVQRGLERYLR